jgi:hypothetical protein
MPGTPAVNIVRGVDSEVEVVWRAAGCKKDRNGLSRTGPREKKSLADGILVFGIFFVAHCTEIRLFVVDEV